MERGAASRGVDRRVASALLLLAAMGVACARAEQEPLRVATSTRLAAAPLFAARASGELPRSEVRLVEFVTNLQSRRTLRVGDVEAAVLASDEVLQLAASHPELELCVARVLAFSHGATAIIGPAELPEGRAVVVGAEPGASSVWLLQRAIGRGALPVTSIEFSPVSSADVEEALEEGRVELVSTSEPNVTRLLDRGLRRWFDTSHVPGEVIDLLVVRRDALPHHAQQLARLQRGLDEELARLRPTAEATKVLLGRARLTADQHRRAMEGLRLIPPADEPALRARLVAQTLELQAQLAAGGLVVDAALAERVLRPCPEPEGAP